QSRGVDRDMTGHRLELESLDDLLAGDDLAVLTAERVRPVRSRRDESPLSTGSDLHLVHGGRIPAGSPPLRDELRVRHRLVDDLARRVELSRDVYLEIRGQRDLRRGATCC